MDTFFEGLKAFLINFYSIEQLFYLKVLIHPSQSYLFQDFIYLIIIAILKKINSNKITFFNEVLVLRF